MAKSNTLQDHPIYKAFSHTYPSPFIAEVDGEKHMFPDAAAYWLLAVSKSPTYREKVMSYLNSLTVLTYWSLDKGLTKLGVKRSDKWDEIKEKRFVKAMSLKFEQNAHLAELLVNWNPKKEPLVDKYKRDDAPDLIETIIAIRKKLKSSKE